MLHGVPNNLHCTLLIEILRMWRYGISLEWHSTWKPTFLNYKDMYFTRILMSIPQAPTTSD